MNKTIADSKVFGKESVELQKFAESKNVDIGIAPVYLSLAALKEVNPSLTFATLSSNVLETTYRTFF